MAASDSPHASPPSSQLRFLAGGGEMGALIRAFDWTQTSLGPPSSWPQPIQTAVGICLNSRFPMVLWLGPDFTMLYNDSWRPVLGATKHPHGLGRPGREVWPEIWHIIGAQMQSVVDTGVATWSDDLLLVVDRYRYHEEAYFTYSYSPIHAESGRVLGVFTAVTETTLRVIGERRLKTLSHLGALIKAKTTAQAISLSAEVLRANEADIPFALIYLLDDSASRVSLAEAIRVAPATSTAPLSVGLASAHPWQFAAVASGQSGIVLDDLPSRFDPLPGGCWPEAPTSALVLPLQAPGRSELAGILIGGISPYRRLDRDYRTFYDLVAGHIATSIANARAYQEAQKRAEALAELDRAKTAFFSNVSHEFRTPLTLILGPLEDVLAKDAHSPLADVHQSLALAHRNGLRLQRLVNTLLDFSRIEAGRVQASYVPTDLAAFTAEVASNFRSTMERANLQFHVDCHPLPEPVYLDRGMWEKIVLNLISNAFKYTLHGAVAVRVQLGHQCARFSVSDTGAGIPEHELPRLFERFHRVESVAGRTHEGSGIGLALVHELAKLHGGSVSVESAVGKGSTFTVSIPLGRAHLPADAIGAQTSIASTAVQAEAYVEEALRWLGSDSPPTSQPSAAPHHSPTILPRGCVLIADDNADMRDYICRLLTPHYRVAAASNGAEALQAAFSLRPDLVLADIMMPALDGFGLLRELRNDGRTKTLPIILLSARAGEEARVEGLQAGADDYLTKPFTGRELLARVDAHLSLARMRRQADEARRLSEVRLGLALQATNLIAWEWDPLTDEIFATGDAETIFGVPLHRSGDGLALLHPDDQDRHRSLINGITANGGSYFSEFRIRHAETGQTVWLEERATAIVDPETGAVVRLAGVLADITVRKAADEELRRRNAELERVNSELEEFAYAASHDLQEPLRTVAIYTQVLLDELNLANEPRPNQFAKFIRDGVFRMELLIKDLLTYSRIVHREQDPPGAVSLARVLELTFDSLRGSLAETEASIHNEAGPAAVVGDEQQLVQVFQNLVSNSLKYRQAGLRPEIRISTARQGGEWIVTVTDNGIGFDQQYAERIFGLFKRLHRNGYPGTGLGLAICKRIVERYNGRIWGSSDGPGKGATFYISLKAATLSAAAPQ